MAYNPWPDLTINPIGPWAQQTEKAYDPETAYLQTLGLGGGKWLNPRQQYARGQFQDVQGLFDLQRRLGTIPGQTVIPDNFAQYAANMFSVPGRNIYGQSQDILRQMFGSTPDVQKQWEVNYDPTYAGGEMASRGNVGELQRLLQTAYGRLGKWLGGNERIGNEQQNWADINAGGGQTGTFLDYIRNKYNLSALLGQ